MKKLVSAILVAVLTLALLTLPASAKTVPAGQTVGNVLFYASTAKGGDILVAQIPVSEMERDMQDGKIDDTLHNYSILDRFVTTVHQEAQGFTVREFIEYAQEKSPLSGLPELSAEWSGDTEIQFWEIDQTGYDDMDSYTYADLYGVERWNFPALYEQWDYETQEYKDVNAIWASRQPELVLLSVRAFSQRYMITEEKFGVDYNMESFWYDSGLPDNQRTMRIMKPMTRDELFDKSSTASDTRYWVSNIRLDASINFTPPGAVAAPTAVMTEYGDNYFVRLSCATPDATILYNHNYISPSYTPTAPYDGSPVVIPKSYFKDGRVTLTTRAVREGYTDAGVTTLTLTSSGTETNPELALRGAWSDVDAGIWFEDAVVYAMGKGLFDETAPGKFSPDVSVTRAQFLTALYRLEGKPEVTSYVNFSDITKGTPLSAAASWAYKNNIVKGTSNAATPVFKPDDEITRQDIATLFYRYGEYKKEDLSVRGDLSAFPDKGDISDYASDALAWANGIEVINGSSDGTISPKGPCTRAMAAQILLNYSKR
ncbi:MAG: S-layer homology domain-containing protein [Oscillospiraceae bacterium]|jgi:hypothetical protein|nr:S-layer homology domain-containing protein [Oscillospiraceae bacterium]